MTFDYPGYPLKFIQRDWCRDSSDHISTYIYKFYSPITTYHYIVRAEYHKHDVFAIKFYCKKDRKSEYKYSKIVNRGDLGNIIMSCAKVIPLLLGDYPRASFSFAASRSIDSSNNTIEDAPDTQRFRMYKYMIPIKFGFRTFNHIAYDIISSYLLHNRNSESNQSDIENMFKNSYTNLYSLTL
ncbi:hypothetical protein HNQ91_005744 [Filimonas zeae]|uniref:Uncharacterized protein n=1 Tax=Filimonas zeae TaxID=1737353 RepID=A0A917MZ02_9BACT|nr:hypothetical protein [Filimonas zeae]GGH82197.1 hypothetical protein GCM10011379_55720 [Filimonas zeae]